jgi:hypothetical protein
VFGAAMVAVVILRPRGLVSRRVPSLTLNKSAVAAVASGEPKKEMFK